MKWTAKLMAHLWRGLLRSRLQAELPAGIERLADVSEGFVDDVVKEEVEECWG